MFSFLGHEVLSTGSITTTNTTATVTYTLRKDQTTPDSEPNPTTQIPIQSSSATTAAAAAASAATKIQSAYRAHIVRSLYRRISAVDSEATRLQKLIQRQETVDAIRREERERLRMNEALMSLLLRLDSVPGQFDPAVREARRKVSRRIVGLQEILDGIAEAKVDCCDDSVLWGPSGVLGSWDAVVGEMEEEVCRERGGEEMDEFCAQYLGFRCLQRFLRH